MDPQPTKLRIEPLLWILFSAGGVVAAFLIPVHLFILGIAAPLGLVKPTEYSHATALLASPLVRFYVFVLCSVPLFHAAHRIRYTLYDGLQIKHLNEVIAAACYGGAVIGTLIAGYLLWSFQ
ncbi:MAG TPA: fumarate reductase subunit FrdD [Candidatus Acidoferrum sp.]|nr:fumarate reductase subunit FrdD [Candidatus Acidoferrum sp.]